MSLPHSISRRRFHSRLLISLLALNVAALLPVQAQENASAPGTFRKVLFLGNSITKHGPKADIDWTGNWGMAATAEDKDYVHVVTAGLAARNKNPGGQAPEIFVKNIADFERAHGGYDIAGKLKEAIDFQADLIILAIGENVPALKTPEEQTAFQENATKLLTALKAGRQPAPVLIVRSSFWKNTAKDEALRQASAAVGGRFVDISALTGDESNYGRAERPYKNAGVANHPGDKGMAAIAAAILDGIAKK